MSNGAGQSNPEGLGELQEGAWARHDLIKELAGRYGLTLQEASDALDALDRAEIWMKLDNTLGRFKKHAIDHSDIFDQVDQEVTGEIKTHLFVGNFDKAKEDEGNDTMVLAFPLEKPDFDIIPIPQTQEQVREERQEAKILWDTLGGNEFFSEKEYAEIAENRKSTWLIDGQAVIAIADLKKRGSLHGEKEKRRSPRILFQNTFYILDDGTVLVSEFDFIKHGIYGSKPFDEALKGATLNNLYAEKLGVDKRKLTTSEVEQFVKAISGAEIMPGMNRAIYDADLLGYLDEDFQKAYDSGKISEKRYKEMALLIRQARAQHGGS